MIISASRRTDIPAFYSQWLLNRLHEGYAMVRHPRNPHRYSRVPLHPDTVDCIVFWTKNPEPMLDKLDTIEKMGYRFYFQFTLTPYDRDIENGLPPKPDLIETFKKLGNRIGAHRVVWRYDPVIISDALDIAYHLNCFEKMAGMLEGYTNRCVFSFVDFYSKIRTALKRVAEEEVKEADMRRIAEGFSEIAIRHHLLLSTCSEVFDLSRYGISHASCIDKKMIEEILGCSISAKKDINQRPACGCIESIDIGTYDCCLNGCIYCYAASGGETVMKNAACHNPDSPALIGKPGDMDVISERKVKSLKDMQFNWFK